MSDTRIVTEKELNYIETLYLYANLQDFLLEDNNEWVYDFNDPRPIKHGLHKRQYPEFMGTELDSRSAYKTFLSYLHDTLLIDENYLNDAKGRSWYSCGKYRIGIMDYDLAKKANQFNALIQYEQHYMFEIMNDFEYLELPFGGHFGNYHIKRIDLTKIAKHKECYIRDFGYISPFRGFSNHKGTIYLGNRDNGQVFRMYDKSKELFSTEKGKKIDWTKIDLLSSYFGDVEDLYTYELELTRVHLKENLGIDTLSDYKKVFDVYKNTVGKIRMYPINDKNMKLLKQNNRKRIKAFTLTNYCNYERVVKKKYEPSFDYAVNKAIKVLNSYVEAMKIKPLNEDGSDNPEFQQTYENLVAKIIEKVISNPFESDKQKIFSNSIHLIENQSNELEVESKRIFASPIFPKNQNLIKRI